MNTDVINLSNKELQEVKLENHRVNEENKNNVAEIDRLFAEINSSNDINDTINLLTIVTIFISIPTLITSFYGMNINLPMQNNPSLLLYLGGIIVFIYFILFRALRSRDKS